MLLQLIILTFQAILIFFSGYLLLLTLAAAIQSRRWRIEESEPVTSFWLLVPAHNEEALLPSLLKSLQQQDYPKGLYRVHVVADNCTDNTAQVALLGGAQVHVRNHPDLRGKGYALQWLLDLLWREPAQPDAIVILDADTVVSENFLRVMDRHFQSGERAIQAYYAVRDPGRSWNVALRYAALAVLHYLRPMGRMFFGASAGLKGNGMAFSSELLRRHPWTSSVVEDIELHMALLLSGERVSFAPDVMVWGEMPATLRQSASQHTRWESGRLEMARRYVPKLMQAGWQALRKGGKLRWFTYLDAIMEHLIPPFSVLVGLSLVILAVASVLYWAAAQGVQAAVIGALHLGLSKLSLWLATSALAAQVFYLLVGLRMAKAPANVYRALLFAPLLVAWKTWHYLMTLLGRKPAGWIRTARNEG
jgi:cellulose synthase/poly-beta-1,6-N-acetylglucosamine synthase-like glycosyltransferase